MIMMKKKEKTDKVVKDKNILPGAIVVGLIVSIIIYLVMINVEKNALADFEKGVIYVALMDIPKGTLVQEDNYSDYLERKELDKDVIPEKAISSPEQINDLIASNTIDKGTMVTLGMFESINDITKNMKNPVIAGCKADDLYQIVGGVLRAGDRVHIYSMDEEGMVMLEWSNVYVQQVFDNTGANIESENKEASAQRINVYLDKVDVEAFYTKLATGNLRVVKVCE